MCSAALNLIAAACAVSLKTTTLRLQVKKARAQARGDSEEVDRLEKEIQSLQTSTETARQSLLQESEDIRRINDQAKQTNTEQVMRRGHKQKKDTQDPFMRTELKVRIVSVRCVLKESRAQQLTFRLAILLRFRPSACSSCRRPQRKPKHHKRLRNEQRQRSCSKKRRRKSTKKSWRNCGSNGYVLA